jgi:hypothetical protein
MLFVVWSVLKQVHCVFQSEFNIKSGPLIPLSDSYLLFNLRVLSSCVRILPCPLVTSMFPEVTCFRTQFIHSMWLIRLAFLRFVVYRVSVSFLTFCNTCSFFTWSVQLIFSILLQKYISKFWRYLQSAFQSVSGFNATVQNCAASAVFN